MKWLKSAGQTSDWCIWIQSLIVSWPKVSSSHSSCENNHLVSCNCNDSSAPHTWAKPESFNMVWSNHGGGKIMSRNPAPSSFVVQAIFNPLPCVWNNFSTLVAASSRRGLNIKEHTAASFPLRKRKLLVSTRECISDMAHCLVCYNYEAKAVLNRHLNDQTNCCRFQTHLEDFLREGGDVIAVQKQ